MQRMWPTYRYVNFTVVGMSFKLTAISSWQQLRRVNGTGTTCFPVAAIHWKLGPYYNNNSHNWHKNAVNMITGIRGREGHWQSRPRRMSVRLCIQDVTPVTARQNEIPSERTPIRTKDEKYSFRDINNNSWLLRPQNIISNTGIMLITMIKAVCRLRCQCFSYTSVRLCWQLVSISTCTGHRLNAQVGR